MTTYPIHPGDRLQRRVVSTIATDLIDLPAFTGFTVTNDRVATETQLPWIAVRISESVNMPPANQVWHLTVTVQMVEDRDEANETLGADTRPRHELRTENLSARLFGIWNTQSIADSINAISNGQGVYVLKTYGQNVATANDEATLGTEYTFTAICVTTQQ